MPDSVRRCFVIGPMNDSADLQGKHRLERLRDEVLVPLFSERTLNRAYRYDVTTPFDLGFSGARMIIRDILHAIDRADVVVADLTDANPNVFYELGITHSLGRQCITILQPGQQLPFDTAAYRCFMVDLDPDAERWSDKKLRAQATLRAAVHTADENVSDWSSWENPVIDFFRAPIAYLSPAPALADGYFRNFVRPVVEAIITRRAGKYLFDVGVAPAGVDVLGEMSNYSLLDDEVRRRLKLQVVLPARIHLAKQVYVKDLREFYPPALVEFGGRSFTCWARGDLRQQQSARLIDIPTTLSVLQDAVDRRMRTPVPRDSPDWQFIERQEIERFRMSLQMRIDGHHENPKFSDRIEIVRFDPASPPQGLEGLAQAHRRAEDA